MPPLDWAVAAGEDPGTICHGPAFGVVGIEEPLPPAALKGLYRDHADYVARFERRLDELVAACRLLPEDADEMRAEAEQAVVP